MTTTTTLPTPLSIHPDAVPPGQSFLAEHIAREHGRGDDILAFVSMRQRLLAASNQHAEQTADRHRDFTQLLKKHELLQPLSFFYEARSGAQLYRPVSVDYEEKAGGGKSLTAVLAHSENQGQHLVLRATSGAGKTIATRRAFFDCFYGVVGEPSLPGFSPCNLDVPPLLETLSVDLQSNDPPDDIVLQLLLTQARIAVTASTLRAMQRWLQFGPRLLIFVDLNRLPEAARRRLARSLASFLQEHAQQGHRLIATFRTTQSLKEDTTLSSLRHLRTSGPLFVPCNLDPLPSENAEHYLRAFWEYDTCLAEEFAPHGAKAVAPHLVDDHLTLVKRFIDRNARGKESLVSTPLLMQFVSEIEPGNSQHIETAADLYREIVRNHLVRDQAEFNNQLPDLLLGTKGRTRSLVALTRLALAMRSRGVSQLDTTVARNLLQQPHATNVASWAPSAGFYDLLNPQRSHCYVEATYDEAEINSLFQFSLLRTSEDERATTGVITFLHDSMIDYFCGAVALGEYLSPGSPAQARTHDGTNPQRSLPDDWYQAVLDVLVGDGVDTQGWLKPGGFLAGTLSADELEKLVRQMLFKVSESQHVALSRKLLDERPTSDSSSSRRLEAYSAALVGRVLTDARYEPQRTRQLMIDVLMDHLETIQ
ncbi:NACHT domain-containing protein [Adhaeretor mobilis]|uniref:NACHT domain-containing protein n=1 Tax=Adhaeretor mobilis TaxID=1930276 RepID=A0A517MQQ5_9BACT|nr:hypothetical protein [Adhaeretor mobilis]QDS97204.1 hypothetical protein HG15A2_04640 [Adhaeretor mobilis]